MEAVVDEMISKYHKTEVLGAIIYTMLYPRSEQLDKCDPKGNEGIPTRLCRNCTNILEYEILASMSTQKHHIGRFRSCEDERDCLHLAGRR